MATELPPYEAKIPEKLRKKLLHDPKLVKHMEDLGKQGADLGNQLANIPDAEYGTMTQNTPETERARVYIRPMNAEATLDDAYHSTMLKVWSGMKSIGGSGERRQR